MLITLIIICLILCGGFILAVMGRRNNPGLEAIRGWAYAHRGLHDRNHPENSLSAFRAAVKAGYGSELDVHLLADGNLAVIHDSDLKRTTGMEGKVEDLTAEDLKNYYLEGTLETIPTLPQVLEVYEGKAPLIIELKSADNNHDKLAETVCRTLAGYRGAYCLESFDPRCLLWLKKHRPSILRGQLTENFMIGTSSVSWFLRFAMTHQLGNFLTMPDFVAYRFTDRLTISNTILRSIWDVQGVTWTLQNKHEYETAIEEDWIPIFENFLP